MISDEMNVSGPPERPMHITADSNRRIPKYCTSVFFAKMKNGQIILTFVENDEALKTGVSDQGVVIERILVDEDHAKLIAEKLASLLSKGESFKSLFFKGEDSKI